MAIDHSRIEHAVADLLAALGDDASRPGLVDTPRRVAEAYGELFAGVDADPFAPLAVDDGMAAEPSGGEAVIVRDLAFRSMCEHHLLPFVGTAHLAYLPGERIVGLGRLARVLEILSSRPQLQERLGEQVADTLGTGIGARGVLVVLDVWQGCVAVRGERQTRSTTVTIAARGELTEPAARASILNLIGPAAA